MQSLIQRIYIEENKRSILSEMRKELKDKHAFGVLYDEVLDHMDFFLALLQHEDAKTRKNVALLFGDLGIEDAMMPLWRAYEKEEQLFVKASYLTAISNLDYDILMPVLHDTSMQLSSCEKTPENKKHIDEQLRVLHEMIISVEGINTHIFKGYLQEHDCILLTNRNYKHITEAALEGEELIPFGAGVRVKTRNLHKLLDIRTYQELLFVIPGMAVCPNAPVLAAKKIADSSLIEMLKLDHKGHSPFYYRIEIKSKQPLDKKSAFAKKVAANIEEYTNQTLINSPGDYEFEIRMIENKDGNYNVLVKYMTIPDVRFDYREHYMPTSIKPSTAALLVALAKEEMIPDAQVLDPFCGVATMLIERQMVVKGNTSYGIDISEEAIQKAKKNMENAGQIIHFVNKDFNMFTHEYKFDEIFTNMPWAIGKTTKDDIYDIYRSFFIHAKTVLKSEATIIMYTHDADLARHFALQQGFQIKKSYSILEKEKTALLIIKTK